MDRASRHVNDVACSALNNLRAIDPELEADHALQHVETCLVLTMVVLGRDGPRLEPVEVAVLRGQPVEAVLYRRGTDPATTLTHHSHAGLHRPNQTPAVVPTSEDC